MIDLTPSLSETAFMESAECARTDPALFDTVTLSGVTARLGSVRTMTGRMPRFKQIALAKAICQVCPVSQECLDFAREHGLTENIYGGLLPDERL
jgi:Transcription factor WhiB